MKDEKKDSEQNHLRKVQPSLLAMALVIGFVGGIIWSGIAYFAYYFHFTEISPTIILEPWAIGGWKKGWLGVIISILLIGILSIVSAFLYYVSLRRIKNMWGGILFGLLLFLLVFLVLNPMFPSIPPFREIGRDTMITSICLYLLYGVFVGYSISYEESEYQSMREKENKNASS
ncbi:YqhR family membrane protein [Bacillus sp. 03113]|uniref:YqhR family membrane protein n=1 Tax=Bacillus sp. 03113 TaxID=2578211 RepID=UPI00114396B5|nr:YqhR family membrane protein [Bacillus sp. 03113]